MSFSEYLVFLYRSYFICETTEYYPIRLFQNLYLIQSSVIYVFVPLKQINAMITWEKLKQKISWAKLFFDFKINLLRKQN